MKGKQIKIKFKIQLTNPRTNSASLPQAHSELLGICPQFYLLVKCI